MNLETIIAEKVHALPVGKQQRVLEFVEDLEGGEIKSNGNVNQRERAAEDGRLSIVGIGASGGSGDVSVRAEEILAEGIDRHSGWTFKEKNVAD